MNKDFFNDFNEYFECEPVGVRLPKIKLSLKELKEIDEKLELSSSSLDLLKSLVRKGIIERGINKLENRQEYYDRAQYELEIFEELGFVDYVLLNWDILGFCHKNDIPVGAGRGSAAGSLILYLLKVTNIDPIPNNLFFERFVSKNRAKKVYSSSGEEFLVGSLLPDVDSDISYDQREKVIKYIEEKHKGKTSKILTFNTFSSKLCIREIAKYFCEVSESEANEISDMIPKVHGVVADLKDAYEEVSRFQDWANAHPLAYKTALKIENLNKNNGVHPSGIAICSDEISSIMPLQKTKDGELVSGYDMNDVADLMVKFDILGLRTLTVAYRTCKKIGINFDDINPHDPEIYKALQDFNHPIGLFQISADTNFRVCKEVRPANLTELSDVVALARPASLQFVSEYKNQKDNPCPLGLDDQLDEILLRSKNVMLFQEQTMQACHKVFGMSLDDAELLRRDIGKKKVEEIPKWKNKIYVAAKQKGLSETVADYFWGVVEAGASYQFNLSHSVSYATLAAKTVYLKYKYPQHFFVALLELAEYEPDPLSEIAAINKELKDFGIKLLPPSLEKSDLTFSIEGNDIRYGLKAIKGISSKSLEALREFRGKKFFSKFEVFAAAKSVGMNISILCALIQAGAMSTSGKNRSRVVLEAQAFNLLTDREKRNFCAMGERFNWDLLNGIAEAVEKKVIAEDGKILMGEKRLATFKKGFDKYLTIYRQNKKFDKLSYWWYENTLLGYSYTYNLKDCFVDDYEILEDTISIKDKFNNETFHIAGVVDDFYTKTSANGNKYMNLTLADDFGLQKFLFMDNRRSSNFSDFMDRNKLKKKDIVVISASRSDETFFVKTIDIIDCAIYMKLKDIKNNDE